MAKEGRLFLAYDKSIKPMHKQYEIFENPEGSGHYELEDRTLVKRLDPYQFEICRPNSTPILVTTDEAQ